MFGLRIVHRRELALYAATIETQRNDIRELRKLVSHERSRAEAAINLVLMKQVRAAITPNDEMTLEQQQKLENAQAKKLDLFGDGQEFSEEEALAKLQQ